MSTYGEEDGLIHIDSIGQKAIVGAITLGVLALMIFEVSTPEVVFLIALVGVMLTEILTLPQVLAGFSNESAKIEGRSISYPVLLDDNSEPRLEDTNSFLEWYCAHCDIVTKKSVVEKAVSWLKACADLARDKRGKGVLDKGVFTSAMRVRVAIQGHSKAYGMSANQ